MLCRIVIIIIFLSHAICSSTARMCHTAFLIPRHQSSSTFVQPIPNPQPKIQTWTFGSDSGFSSERDAPKIQLFAPNHIGGRKPRRFRKSKTTKRFLLPWKWTMATMAALLLVFSLIMADKGENPSYAYYSSSVYESTVIRSNGKIESTRNEKFESNLPDLVRQRKNDPSSSIILLQEKDIDRQIQENMDSIMRFQQTILDDFF